MLTESDHRGPAVRLHILISFAGFQIRLLRIHKCRDLIKLGGNLFKLTA